MYLALKHSSEMTLKTSKTLKNAHSSNDAKTPLRSLGFIHSLISCLSFLCVTTMDEIQSAGVKTPPFSPGACTSSA